MNVQQHCRMMSDKQSEPVGVSGAPAGLRQTQHRKADQALCVVDLSDQLADWDRPSGERDDGRGVENELDGPQTEAYSARAGSRPICRRSAAALSGVRRARRLASRALVPALPSGVTWIPTSASWATVSPFTCCPDWCAMDRGYRLVGAPVTPCARRGRSCCSSVRVVGRWQVRRVDQGGPVDAGVSEDALDGGDRVPPHHLDPPQTVRSL